MSFHHKKPTKKVYINKFYSFIAVSWFVLLLTACGGGVQDHFSQNAPKPPELTLSADDKNQWLLSWEKSSSAQGYKLYWSESPDLVNANEVTVNPLQTQIDVLDLAKDLKAGDSLFFTVAAVWEGKVGEKTEIFEYIKQPSPPTEVTLLSARGRNVIIWQENINDTEDQKYNVYWSTKSDISISNFENVEKGITDNSFTLDSTVYEDKPYLYYLVTVERDGVESVVSEVIEAEVIALDSVTFSAPPAVTTEATGLNTFVALGSPVVEGLTIEPLIENDAPENGFTVGEHIVKWTTLDDYGDVLSDTQVVKVIDSTLPVLTVPPELIVETTGDSIILPGLGDALATDIFDVTVSHDAPDSLLFTVGTHLVSWTAKDANNNVATANQSITVNKTRLVCNAPSAIRLEATAELTSVTADILGQATASGFEETSLTISNDLPADGLALGQHNIRWTCKDAQKNVKTALQSVIIQDLTKPVFPTELPSLSFNTFSDRLLLTSLTQPKADDIFLVGVTSNAPDPLAFSVGSHVVIWTAEDSSGNKSTLNQTITITKNPLVCTAPADRTIEARDVLTLPTVSELGEATSNGFDPDSISMTHDLPDNGLPLGSHTIRWTCADDENNLQTAEQTLTIIDTTKPEFPVALPTILQVTTGSSYTFESLPQPLVSDIFSVTLNSNAPDPLQFSLGAHVVTWTAEDGSGNKATLNQQITITKETLICNAPESVEIEARGLSTIPSNVELGNVTTSGFDSNSLAITNNLPSAGLPLGVHIITWTCADDQNNQMTAMQSITVNDTTTPEFSGDLPDIIEETLGNSFTFASLPQPDALDIFPVTLSSNAPSPIQFALGSYVVTWTAEDSSGNKAIQTQKITINKTPLVCTAPDDKTLEARAAKTLPTSAELGQVMSSGFDLDSLVITNDMPGGGFPPGVYDINWVCSDGNNNQKQDIQSIRIEDTTKPVINVGSNPMSVYADIGETLVNVPLGSASARDLVSEEQNIVIDHSPKNPYPLGTTLVTWTAIDEAGNESNAYQTVGIKPYIPQNVVAKEITKSSIQISWDAVPSAIYYTIYWTSQTEHGELPVPGNGNTQILTSVSNTITHSNLQELSQYHYVVSATNAEGESKFTPVFSQYTTGTLPTSIAYYPFNGDALDNSGNELNGVLNGPTLTTDRGGNSNSAYQFDGINDDITIAYDPILNLTDQITLAAWVYPTSTKTQHIVMQYDSAAYPGYVEFASFALALTGTNEVVFSIRQNNTYVQARKPSYTLNQWAHIVGTYDGQSMKLYVNGKLETEKPVSGPITTNVGPMHIGARKNIPSDNFHGKLDDISVYSVALTSAEVASLFSTLPGSN